MKSELRRQEILQEINSITRMERGKLCLQSRRSGSPPFHKLQCWHQGRNQTRYVPAEEVSSMQEALAGHERFQQLAEEFVDLTIGQTRASDAERKKNFKKSKPSATRKPKPS
ncbi:MAG TPA: hypothetical protein VH619_03300 [Verrucomicrobiae bacterium]|jgi:hypothetical protein|nr:hypothetical protein [Verrucomicrobiae bacterium]